MRRRRLEAARNALRSRLEVLEREHRLALWLDRNAADMIALLSLPAALPGATRWLPVFAVRTGQLSEAVDKMRASCEYLDRLVRWEQAGAAVLKPSETVPGDLDLWIDPDVIPEAPDQLRTATLDGAQILAIVGIIAAVLALGYGSDVLIERERSSRNALDKDLARSILEARAAGTISQADTEAILGFVSDWQAQATAETAERPSAISEIPGLIKLAIAGAIGLGVINVILSFKKDR